MSCAVGTSLMIIAVNSLFGFTGELVSGESVAWIFLSSLAGIAAIGIAIGTYMAKFVSERVLKKSFGFFVLAMGLVILVEQLSK
ncbi:MAG: TSUP family transporter [Bdellovibrionota bacterium]